MNRIPVIIVSFVDFDMEDPVRIRTRVENATALNFITPKGADDPFQMMGSLTRAVVSTGGVPMNAAHKILRRATRGRIKLTIGVMDDTGVYPLTEFDPGWERGCDPN